MRNSPPLNIHHSSLRVHYFRMGGRMKFKRSSGILLHPTSLPGRFGVGDLGGEAYRLVDWLAAAGQVYWQIMPLGPTGYGDSPYSSFSAFAGNTNLVSPEKPDESLRGDYEGFRDFASAWLEDWALFAALKDEHGGESWHKWGPGLARREAAAVEGARANYAEQIEAHKVFQYLFFPQ